MKPTAKQMKLIAPSVQTIEISDGVIVKRGATEVMITGSGAAEAVKMVLDAAASDGASIEEIHRLFDHSSIPWVDTLINELRSRRLLVPKDVSTGNGKDNNLDIFFWQFGETKECSLERFSKIRLVILGVNQVSRQIALSLAACGYNNFRVFDHPQHRSQDLLTTNDNNCGLDWPEKLDLPQAWNEGLESDLGNCLVATSDFGGQRALSKWNTLCLNQGVHFLPVLLKNMVGYVGPMVIPGETACYECLLSRQRSNSVYPDAERRTGDFADAGQAGFHPSMATMLGAIAAFEISRFYGISTWEQPPGRFLEVNLLAGSMMRRTVLKVPRCSACSPLHKISQPNLSKILFPKRPPHQGKDSGEIV